SVDGKRVRIPYAASFAAREDGNELIAPLWAAQRIGYLLDEIRLHGQERELIEEVTELARRFGIVTPYTSYLIMEDERANVRRQDQTFVAAPQAAASLRGEYDAMNAAAGASSVQASKEVAAMKSANAQQPRNIQGRAIYQVGNNWIDSKVQAMKQQNVRRIQFASADWFDLLHKEPQAAQFLALGKNIRFALNATDVVEVYE